MDLYANEDRDPARARKLLENKSSLNYISGHPTLQHMAMVTVVTKLLNVPDISNCLKEDENSYLSENLTTHILFTKLNELNLPQLVKKQVSYLFRPMLKHLIQFLTEWSKKIVNVNSVLEEINLIQWTNKGTVNKVKTIEKFIKRETSKDIHEKNISQRNLFYFACHYCLEEYVSTLWLSLSSDEQKKVEKINEKYKCHLIAYWVSIVKHDSAFSMNEIRKYDIENIYDLNLTINQNMVSLCIYLNNPFSLKYFWNKLEAEEKETNLSCWLCKALTTEYILKNASYNPKAYIFCFLLSQQRSLTQQIKIFQTFPFLPVTFLKSLLHAWPLQKHFFPTFSIILDYISPKQYAMITYPVFQAQFGDNYLEENLLERMWTVSPSKLKRAFIRIWNCSVWFSVWKLIAASGIEVACMLLKEATEGEKRQIIFQMLNEKNSGYLVTSYFRIVSSLSNWKLVDVFLSTVLPSKLDVVSFKLNSIWKCRSHVFTHPELKNHIEEYLTWSFDLMHEVSFTEVLFLETIEIYISLIYFNSYDFVEKFLNWAFKNNKDVCDFKESLNNEERHKELFFLLREFSKNGVEGWDQCEKFINYSFHSTEAINAFKNTSLRYFHLFFNDFNFLDQKLDFCNLFCKWIFTSDNDVIQFKNELLLSQPMVEDFFFDLFSTVQYDSSCEQWLSVRETLKWFSPQKKTLTAVRPLFSQVKKQGLCDNCCLGCSRHERKLKILLNLHENLTLDDNELSKKNLEDLIKELSNCYIETCENPSPDTYSRTRWGKINTVFLCY